MATTKAATGKTAKTASTKRASASRSSSKSDAKGKTKTTTARPKSKPAKGILRQAGEVVSGAIAGVAKPAATGVKAGTAVFLQEVAGSISGGRSANSDRSNVSVGSAAKPKARSVPKKPTAERSSSGPKTARKNK